jgi:hypothetical protein
MLTKKDFKMMADILNRLRKDTFANGEKAGIRAGYVSASIFEFADYFATKNPLDRKKFLAACGLKD